MTAPKLCFHPHSEDWKSESIGNILSIKHGKDYKHLSGGNIPVLGTGGQIACVSESLCDWPCVLIGRKGTINKPMYMDRPFWSVDTLFYSKPQKGQDPKFQYYLFQTIDWLKFNEASGVPSLSAATIENIPVFVPIEEEQQKIAAFFTVLDEKIQIIDQQIQALDRMKEQFSMELLEQERRFNSSEFADWTTTTVGDVADICGGGTPSTANEDFWNGEIQWLTPTEIDSKYVHQSKRTISDSGLKNSSAKLLPIGSLLLTTRATLGSCSINNLQEPVCTNQGFQSLICTDKVLPEFLYYVVTDKKFKNEMVKRASGSTFLEISPKNLKPIPISIPNTSEQKKISDFLGLIDSKILLFKSKKTTFEKLKTAFMQQMFV